MALLRSEFHFELNNLLVEKSALGATIDFQRAGYRIQIYLPSEDGGFPDPEESTLKVFGDQAGIKDGGPIRTVLVIRVAVWGDGPVGAVNFEHPEDDGSVEGAIEEGINFLERTFYAAEAATADLIDWMRIHGQPWLALHGEKPRSIDWSSLFDETVGRPLPVAFRGAVLPRFPAASAIGRNLFSSMSKLLDENGQTLPIAETLLADSHHFLASQPPDLSRAVLLAAIASEVKVKEVLRLRSSPQVLPVLDLLLENPRDWSMAAAALFDKAMLAVTGTSLRTSHRVLFNGISDLFAIRNRIAHRGEKPSEEAAKKAIVAATQTFAWLNGLPIDGGSEQTNT